MGLDVVVVDPSGFTPPYDAHFCSGLSDHVDSVELITCRGFTHPTADGGFGTVEHFYRFYEPRSSSLPTVAKGLEHVVDTVRLAKYIKSTSPDIVHVQWSPLPVVDRWFFEYVSRHVDTVLTVHDTTPFRSAPSSRVQMIGARSVVSAFDKAIVHTEYSRQNVTASADVDHSDVEVIPHGLIHYPDDGAGERATDSRLQILYFGNIKDYKGVDTLIRSIHHLDDDVREQVAVTIAGSPQTSVERYERLAEEHGVDETIEWRLERIPDERLAELFTGSDVLVLPYRDIDQSGVLMTAAKFGVPVVASNVGGFGELLTHGESALLFESESAEGLTEQLQTVAESEETRSELRAGIERFAAETPSWSQIGCQTVSLYESITSRT